MTYTTMSFAYVPIADSLLEEKQVRLPELAERAKLLEKGDRIAVTARRSVSRTAEVMNRLRYRASFFPLYPLHIEIHYVFVNRLLKSPRGTQQTHHCQCVTIVHTPMKIDARHDEMDMYSFAEKVQSLKDDENEQ